MKHLTRIAAFLICLCLSCTSAFATLTELVQNAAADSTVTLTEDEVIGSSTKVTVNKSLTIDLDGKSICKSTDGYAWSLITISGDNITVTIKNGTIVGSMTDYSDDSAIKVNNGKLILENVTVDDSNVGVWVEGSTGSLVVGDEAKITGSNVGVGVYNSGTVTVTEEAEITQNGQGVFGNGGTVIVRGGKVSENTRSGIFLYDSALTVTGGEISQNTNDLAGGGIYAANGSTDTVSGGTITGNSANIAGGIGFDGTDNTLTLSGGTVNGNTAGECVDDVLIIEGKAELSGTAIGEAASTVYLNEKEEIDSYSYTPAEGAALPKEITVIQYDMRQNEPITAYVTEGTFATGYSGGDASEFKIASYPDSYLYMVVIENGVVKLVLNPNPKKSNTVYYNEGDTLNIKGRGWIITELSFNEETGRYEWYLVNQQELTNEEMADPEGTLEKMLGDKKGDITAMTADQKVLDRYFGGKHNHIMIYCTSEILH